MSLRCGCLHMTMRMCAFLQMELNSVNFQRDRLNKPYCLEDSRLPDDDGHEMKACTTTDIHGNVLAGSAVMVFVCYVHWFICSIYRPNRRTPTRLSACPTSRLGALTLVYGHRAQMLTRRTAITTAGTLETLGRGEFNVPPTRYVSPLDRLQTTACHPLGDGCVQPPSDE